MRFIVAWPVAIGLHRLMRAARVIDRPILERLLDTLQLRSGKARGLCIVALGVQKGSPIILIALIQIAKGLVIM